jgi:hypothetical protein
MRRLPGRPSLGLRDCVAARQRRRFHLPGRRQLDALSPHLRLRGETACGPRLRPGAGRRPVPLRLAPNGIRCAVARTGKGFLINKSRAARVGP